MPHFTQGYALIIGIADYLHVRKLPQSVIKDAEDINDLLGSEHYCGYLDTNIRVLLNEQATGQTIRQALAWLADTVKPEDTVLLFFSGHGAQIEDEAHADNYN